MHPVLVSITDSFFIGTYGLMIALGLVAGMWLMVHRGGRRGYNPAFFSDLAFVTVLVGFLGARLTYIIVEWEQFVADPLGLLLSRQGFVFLGGLVAGVLGGIVFVRKRGLPILDVGDVAAPSIALAHAFGRVGCHFAGCCFGGVCTVPAMGIRLQQETTPDGHIFGNAWSSHIDDGLILPSAEYSLPVWPVQLFEAVGLLAISLFLVWFAARRPRPSGQVLGAYLVAYPLLRFALEFLRGDAGRGFLIPGVLSTSQFLALALMPFGVWLLVRSKGKPVSPYSHPSVAPQPPAPEEPEQKAENQRPAPPRRKAARASR